MLSKTRILSFILALVMIIAVLVVAGCNDTPDESSGDASANSSAQTSESETNESTSESETSELPQIDTEMIEKIDALLKNTPDRTRKAINLAAGATYTSPLTAHASYPDDSMKKLTDGNEPLQFSNNDWAGFSGIKSVSFDVQLGDKGVDISDFVARGLMQTPYGINVAVSMQIYISDDGVEFTQIGKVVTPDSDKMTDNEIYDYALRLPGTITTKYVRFEFTYGTGAWFFIGELKVIKYEGEPEVATPTEIASEEYYGKGNIVFSAEEKLWSSSDSDYETYQNLLKGTIPDISALSPIPSSAATDFYNQMPSNKKLTDGKYATAATYGDQNFFRITRGDGRILIFDLGALSTVDSFKIGFLREEATGVSAPVDVFIYGSADGIGWQSIGVASKIYPTKSSEILRVEKQLDKAYNIRYLKVYFMVAAHAYVDEIELFGTKKLQAGAATINPEETPVIAYRDKYITPDEFLGVENMLLSYHCQEKTEGSGIRMEEGLITVEEYKPYVGYYNTDGELVDTLFDAYLYLPYTAYNYSNHARSADGWRFYVENHFVKDRNVDALNQATQIVKDELGLDADYKNQVFFSILYTFPKLNDKTSKNNFGDIDGDGVDEDFANIDDRKKAIKWIIDEQIKGFEAGDYNNLSLGGFYWFEEFIAYSDPHELDLIEYAREYVHSLGYKLFWIPYYRATGYNDWVNLGFDLACMQPNYAFVKDADISRLYSNASITKLLGMCVEIEINDAKNHNDVRRFKEYLYVGAETGYMNAVKIYYQGGVPSAFYSLYESSDPYMRSAYDELYLFAKGKLVPPTSESTNETPKMPDQTFEVKMNKILNVATPYQWETHFEIKLVQSPKYGTLKLNPDGTFRYEPLKGFAGTDSFELRVVYPEGEAIATTITIEVLQQ